VNRILSRLFFQATAWLFQAAQISESAVLQVPKPVCRNKWKQTAPLEPLHPLGNRRYNRRLRYIAQMAVITLVCVATQAATNTTLPSTNSVARAVVDPVEKEYQKILAMDDEAQEEADKWIKENQSFQDKGAGILQSTLRLRIEKRFEPVRAAYEDFILRHPKHAKIRLAFGSFLDDLGEELEAVKQWEKARDLEPGNPAAWNNLANYYGHYGPLTNAFICYEKAIEINPKEPLYYRNFATTISLYRKDAMEHYQIDEQKVFDRSLEFFQKALDLQPDNFLYANDLAQSYYGIRPPRITEAIKAWNYALKTAKDNLQKEGIYVHLARNEIMRGNFAIAKQQLNSVTNQTYQVLKDRLLKLIETKTKETETPTNAPAIKK